MATKTLQANSIEANNAWTNAGNVYTSDDTYATEKTTGDQLHNGIEDSTDLGEITKVEIVVEAKFLNDVTGDGIKIGFDEGGAQVYMSALHQLTQTDAEYTEDITSQLSALTWAVVNSIRTRIEAVIQ